MPAQPEDAGWHSYHDRDKFACRARCLAETHRVAKAECRPGTESGPPTGWRCGQPSGGASRCRGCDRRIARARDVTGKRRGHLATLVGDTLAGRRGAWRQVSGTQHAGTWHWADGRPGCTCVAVETTRQAVTRNGALATLEFKAHFSLQNQSATVAIMLNQPLHQRLSRRLNLGAVCLFALLLVSCGDDGGGSGSDGVAGGTPVWDGPIGDNGLFRFTPAAPGAAPGIYVVATQSDGTTWTSDSVEVTLAQYPIEDVERDRFNKSGRTIFDDPEVLAAEPRPFDVIQGPTYELTLEGGFVRDVPPELRAEARVTRLVEQIADLPEQDQKDGDCPGRAPARVYTEIGSFGGRTAWASQQFSLEEGGRTRGYSWAIHFAPEGVYLSLQQSDGIAFVPNAYAFGIQNSVGFSRETSAGEIDGIATQVFPISGPEGRQVSLAMSIAEFWQIGFTVGLNDNGSLQRALQADQGWNIAANLGMPLAGGLFGLSFPVSIGAGVGQVISKNGGNKVYVFVHGWTGRCADMARIDGASAKSSDDGAAFFADIAESIALAADPAASSYDGVMRDALATALLPMFSRWATDSGAPPAEGIPAENNAALLQDFMGEDSPTLCQDCADSTLDGFLSDTLVRFRVAGDDMQGLMVAAVEAAAHYQRVVPQPGRVAVDSAASAGAVDVASAYAFDEIAEVLGTPNRYVADEVVRIEAQAGTPTRIVVTAAEIAELLGVPVADVSGATVCIGSDFAGPRADEACAALEGDAVGGDITLRQSTRILLRVRVDLSTAAGFSAEDVSDWEVNAAMRYVVAVPGPAVGVEITAPYSAWSGAPVTLTASLMDENGNYANEPVTFSYYDHAGQLLGTVVSDDGQGTLQVVLERVEPEVVSVAPATFALRDGSTVEGWSVEGEGLSRDAQVFVNDVPVSTFGWELGPLGARELAVVRSESEGSGATEFESGSSLVVENPGGLRSNLVRFP